MERLGALGTPEGPPLEFEQESPRSCTVGAGPRPGTGKGPAAAHTEGASPGADGGGGRRGWGPQG